MSSFQAYRHRGSQNVLHRRAMGHCGGKTWCQGLEDMILNLVQNRYHFPALTWSLGFHVEARLKCAVGK